MRSRMPSPSTSLMNGTSPLALKPQATGEVHALVNPDADVSEYQMPVDARQTAASLPAHALATLPSATERTAAVRRIALNTQLLPLGHTRVGRGWTVSDSSVVIVGELPGAL